MSVIPKGHLPIVECEECERPWVIRLAFKLDGAQSYAYQRDCKHKRAAGRLAFDKHAPGPFLPA